MTLLRGVASRYPLFPASGAPEREAILADSPRRVEFLDLLKYGDYFREDLEDVLLGPDVGWERIDLTIPLILACEAEGRRFQIDGRHRLAKALKLGCKFVPAINLMADETKSANVGRTCAHEVGRCDTSSRRRSL